MSSLRIKGSGLLRKLRLPVRAYSKSENEKDKEKDLKEPQVTREKGVKSKTESIQEESYFHKEEVEQLKDLKKKLEEQKPKTEEK